MSILALSERDPRVAENGRKTLAEELRLQLADEIVRGVLAPGAALDETELAERFKCRARRCAKRSASSRQAV